MSEINYMDALKPKKKLTPMQIRAIVAKNKPSPRGKYTRFLDDEDDDQQKELKRIHFGEDLSKKSFDYDRPLIFGYIEDIDKSLTYLQRTQKDRIDTLKLGTSDKDIIEYIAAMSMYIRLENLRHVINNLGFPINGNYSGEYTLPIDQKFITSLMQIVGSYNNFILGSE